MQRYSINKGYERKMNDICEQYLKKYEELLLMDIIQECVVKARPIEDTIKLGIMELINNTEDSVFKKQIQFVNRKKLINNDGKIIIDEYLESFNSSSFLRYEYIVEEEITREFFEQNSNLDSRYCNLNQDMSYKLINKNIELITKSLNDVINNCNIEELFFTLYIIINKVANLSSYLVLKLNDDKDFVKAPETLLYETFDNLEKEQLKIASSIIAEQKSACNKLFNIVYKIYLEKDVLEECESTNIDIISIFAKAMFWNRMMIYKKSNKLLYYNKGEITVENFHILQSINLSLKLENLMDDVIDLNFNEKIIQNIFDKYKELEGYSPNDLQEFIDNLFKFMQNLTGIDKNATTIFICTKEELSEKFLSFSNLEQHVVDKFIKILCLDTERLENANNKLSSKPIVKIKNDQYMISLPLLMQASTVFGNKFLDLNFIESPEIKKFITKNYDEILINDLVDVFNKKGIYVKEHVILTEIKNKDITKLFVKYVTQEIDLVYIHNKIMYFVEYKAWNINSYNLGDFSEEYFKVKNIVNSHESAIKIVKKYKKTYEKVFGEILHCVEDIKLIMVFQNPNAFNYLNDNKDVGMFTFNEFYKHIHELK